MSGAISKTNDELMEYIQYCHETAECVRLRLSKYKKETETTINTYGW
jgi:hypothetical protein